MSKKVMIVDDSRSIRIMMRLALEEAGYAVVEAESGPISLIKLAQETVDLIFLDFIMPEMNGIDFLMILKSIPETSCIPVVIVTTEKPGQWKQQGKRLGCNGWLVKPFKQDQLLHLTRKILNSECLDESTKS